MKIGQLDSLPALLARLLVGVCVGVCVALLVTTLLAAKPYSEWGADLLIVIAIVGVATYVALLLSRYYLGRITKSIVTHQAEVIKAALTRGEQVGELLTQEGLSNFERVMDVKTIWIVGADFSSDIAPDQPFLDVVRHNIHERKVHYQYIAPAQGIASSQLSRLRDAVGTEQDEDLLDITLLPGDYWDRLPYTVGNFTLYDPESIRAKGYFWYPGGDGKLFGPLRENVILQWVAKIKEVCADLDTHSA